MNIKTINKAIHEAAIKMLNDGGNSDERDNLLRASANLILLEQYAKNTDVKSVLDIVQRLVSLDELQRED